MEASLLGLDPILSVRSEILVLFSYFQHYAPKMVLPLYWLEDIGTRYVNEENLKCVLTHIQGASAHQLEFQGVRHLYMSTAYFSPSSDIASFSTTFPRPT